MFTSLLTVHILPKISHHRTGAIVTVSVIHSSCDVAERWMCLTVFPSYQKKTVFGAQSVSGNMLNFNICSWQSLSCFNSSEQCNRQFSLHTFELVTAGKTDITTGIDYGTVLFMCGNKPNTRAAINAISSTCSTRQHVWKEEDPFEEVTCQWIQLNLTAFKKSIISSESLLLTD